MSVSNVTGERLWDRIERLADTARDSAGGITRLEYTGEARAGRSLVKKWMEAAGLSVTVDPIGNIFGRLEGSNPEAGAVLLASHIDSVPQGGRFDGPLGVLAALEAVETLVEQGRQPAKPVEVGVLVNEEGARFEGGLLGSRAVTRGVTPGFLRELVDDDGVSCYQALLDFGLDPEKVEEAQRSPDEFAAYVELHVEQAAVLEDEGLPAGVVTGIAGPKFISVELEGRADHAGATPMDLRRDALAGGAELVLAAERIAWCEAGPATVCTVGQLRVSPGATNVIPGSCVLSFDLRDIDLEARDRAEEQLYTEFQRVCSERDLEGTWQTSIGVEPVVLPEELVETIAEACHRAGQEDFRLVSGAAHDAMNFVDVCPVGMVFVRSRDGVSHSPEEYTSPEDAAVGAEIMFHTVCILADACE